MTEIVVIISVDWEGRSLLPENLQAIEAFRRRHPNIPFQHFLNPAYYTRAGIHTRETTAAIERVLLPADEHGLHVHAWRSLITAAGVQWVASPRFIDDAVQVPKAADDWGFYPAEEGYDVPLEAYSAQELGQIFEASRALLVAHGFRPATTFRAGGWMSGSRVQRALVERGFRLDCSAVNPELAIQRFGDIPLCRWLRELWPTIDCTSQPYHIETGVGGLWQLPNNGGLMDYATAEQTIVMFNKNVERVIAQGHTHAFFSTGFHQETARLFLDRLDTSVEEMRRTASERGVSLRFAASPLEFLGCHEG